VTEALSNLTYYSPTNQVSSIKPASLAGL